MTSQGKPSTKGQEMNNASRSWGRTNSASNATLYHVDDVLDRLRNCCEEELDQHDDSFEPGYGFVVSIRCDAETAKEAPNHHHISMGDYEFSCRQPTCGSRPGWVDYGVAVYEEPKFA